MRSRLAARQKRRELIFVKLLVFIRHYEFHSLRVLARGMRPGQTMAENESV